MKIRYIPFALLFSFNGLAQDFSDLAIPREKVYLGLNKPYYLAGDSITIEANIVDAQTLKTDTLSLPLYVELIDNQQKKMVERWTIKLADNKATFKIKIPNDFNTNYYQLRAYTNWMCNFSVESFATIDVLIFNKNYQQTIPEILPEVVVASLGVSLEGGTCVAGLVNNLYVQTKDNFQKGIKVSVMLKSESTVLRIFETDENGEALVEFEPEFGKKYVLETNNLTREIPSTESEGVVLRGYFTNAGKKIIVSLQNNIKNTEMPTKLIFQCRGQVIQTLLVKPKKGIATLSFETEAFPEGILNVALIDFNDKILAERIFSIARQNKDLKQNYFLFNAELDRPIDETQNFNSEFGKANAALISRRNLLYNFSEIERAKQDIGKLMNYKNEFGISVKGKVKDDEISKIKGVVTISLVLIPEQNDSLKNNRQLLVTTPDKDGFFDFENLDFYGKSAVEIKATLGKKMFNVELIKDSIPTIISQNKKVDWRMFKTVEQAQNLGKEANRVFENIALEERMKIRELEGVTVTAKKTKKSPISYFNGDPSARFLPDKIMGYGAASTFNDFFEAKISYRLKKHLSAVIKFFVNDVEVEASQMDLLPSNEIAYVDIFDGTPESALVNASVLVNLYTKGYFLNPVVGEIMAKDKSYITLKTQREGYYTSK